ncbi:P-loop containing nucleoside triphosphate hydrolase protein [Fomitopsis serialis]|uniref:P-loop containing nucleoside triphosphate hydrolase protein n=1 Tax=Fomitopsis serialis TaxID=139415 RepID=UPI002008C655|nr:P-loop containing nucleoside triphosphate hydrolase protein [Neoantrodia serialis]KAH9931007.1 P-loop containing nucleoside triphosphate hydrolase protein [Neoantrodia serialis]
MGPTGTGKSTFLNLASGSKFGVGTSLQSETAVIQPTEPFKVGSQRVVLVDTPGFDDTLKSDREILSMIAEYLADLHSKNIKIKGVMYLHRITDNRMGGTALRNFRMFEALCGKDSMPNAVIVLNMWNQVGKDIREAREKELRESDDFFKQAVDAGASVMPHDGQRSSADAILAYLLKQKPVSLQIQNETMNEDKKISQTAAGMILLGELAKREVKQSEELQRLRRQLDELLEEGERKDLKEAQMDLERAREKLQDEKGRLQDAGALVRRNPDSDGAQSFGQKWWDRARRAARRRQTA